MLEFNIKYSNHQQINEIIEKDETVKIICLTSTFRLVPTRVPRCCVYLHIFLSEILWLVKIKRYFHDDLRCEMFKYVEEIICKRDCDQWNRVVFVPSNCTQ